MPDDHFRPAEKWHTDNFETKLSGELGHDFVGFVSLNTEDTALEFSSNILQLAVLNHVRKRLIYFCDGSLRLLCGAAGIVWPKSLTCGTWEGKGEYYPAKVDSTATIELFGIRCTLETAISDMDTARADVAGGPARSSMSYRGNPGQTRSNYHGMANELFVFTDDINALQRISGKLPYFPNGEVANQVKAISEHSKTLYLLGVHVELHLSPGHSGVPGNVRADAMAKRTQRQLLADKATAWPAIKEVD